MPRDQPAVFLTGHRGEGGERRGGEGEAGAVSAARRDAVGGLPAERGDGRLGRHRRDRGRRRERGRGNNPHDEPGVADALHRLQDAVRHLLSGALLDRAEQQLEQAHIALVGLAQPVRQMRRAPRQLRVDGEHPGGDDGIPPLAAIEVRQVVEAVGEAEVPGEPGIHRRELQRAEPWHVGDLVAVAEILVLGLLPRRRRVVDERGDEPVRPAADAGRGEGRLDPGDLVAGSQRVERAVGPVHRVERQRRSACDPVHACGMVVYPHIPAVCAWSGQPQHQAGRWRILDQVVEPHRVPLVLEAAEPAFDLENRKGGPGQLESRGSPLGHPAPAGVEQPGGELGRIGGKELHRDRSAVRVVGELRRCPRDGALPSWSSGRERPC